MKEFVKDYDFIKYYTKGFIKGIFENIWILLVYYIIGLICSIIFCDYKSKKK